MHLTIINSFYQKPYESSGSFFMGCIKFSTLLIYNCAITVLSLYTTRNMISLLLDEGISDSQDSL